MGEQVKQKVKIVAECVCDLPRTWFLEHNVDIVYFSVETDRGVFADTSEISSENLIEYIVRGGKKALSMAPSPETYREVFENNLEEYDEVILVTISSKISLALQNAQKALDGMDAEYVRRIHLFDSWHLSSGLGHMVVRAGEMAESGASVDEILAALEVLKGKVSTGFIAESVDYLYRNGKVSEKVKKICTAFDIHPILEMKDGALVLKSVTRGNYRKACISYIKRTLRKSKNIDRKSAYITHAGCSAKMIDFIKKEVAKVYLFDNLTVTKASATVSSNCGPNTFGILFIRK